MDVGSGILLPGVMDQQETPAALEADRRILTETSVQNYFKKMEEILPEQYNDSLLHFHQTFKTEMMLELQTKGPCTSDQEEISEALDDAFFEILDLNWKRCESHCADILTELRGTASVSSFLSSSASSSPSSGECQGRWWKHVEELRRKYIDSVGESLYCRMQHLWLSYLDERQEEDFKILTHDVELQKEEQREKSTEGATENADKNDEEREEEDEEEELYRNSIPGTKEPADTTSMLPSNQNKTCEEVSASSSGAVSETKYLWLQLTWGRILVFWKYWIDSRKETIAVLRNLVDVLESEDSTLPSVAAVNQDQMVRRLLDRTREDESRRNLPLDFPHSFGKDFHAYQILIRKLRDFFSAILSPDYINQFNINPISLFQNISTFRLDTNEELSDACEGFKACATFLECEEGAGDIVGDMMKDQSKPLLHLKTILRQIAETSRGNQMASAIRVLISALESEESQVSRILAESIDALLTVASNVSETIPHLRIDIEKWSAKREETVDQLRIIIEKLHKTSKDVSITQTVSSSVGIVGGVVAIAGLIAAPFTLGLSLIPTAIAGGVISGAGAATAIGATITEMVIDKSKMEKASNCIQEDKVLFEAVANQIKFMNRNSTLLLKYIPQDELESFISVMTDPKSTIIQSLSSSSHVGPRFAINLARLVSVGGKAVVMPVSRMVLAGTIAASRVALLAVAHGIAAIGVALDIANLVWAGVKLGKGAKSENAEKLEELVKDLEEEKRIIDNYLNDIRLDSN